MLFLHSNLYNDYFLNFLSCNFTYKIRAPGGPFWESITSFKTSFGVILKKRIWHVRSSKIRETSPAETFSREREENYWYWKYPNLKRDIWMQKKIFNLRLLPLTQPAMPCCKILFCGLLILVSQVYSCWSVWWHCGAVSRFGTGLTWSSYYRPSNWI